MKLIWGYLMAGWIRRHQWVEVERIGTVVTYRCLTCPKGKTRLRKEHPNG